MDISKTWGTTAAERMLAFPCDANLPDANDAYYRGITIHASPETVFLWLCQMQAGSYSYRPFSADRGVPPLTPGLDRLERGKIFMEGFTLVDFERNRQITIKTVSGELLIGKIHVSYLILDLPDGDTRLLVKVALKYPSGLLGWGIRALLPWGDFIMMRKQLLNFKSWSETAAVTVPA
jgi:hypothetical protein